MKIQTRILLSVAASLAISALIVLVVLSNVRGMQKEAARNRIYDEIRDKTHSLNLLASRVGHLPDPTSIRQIREVQWSLENLLDVIPSPAPGDQPIIRRIRTNSLELGSSIEKLISTSRAPGGAMETERHDILLSRLLMRSQFISDDTHHLTEMSQARFASMQRNAVLLTVVVIVALMLANTAISFFTGRKILRIQEGLRQALAKAEEGDRLLSALMEHVPEGITMADAALNLTRVSRHDRERFGIPYEGKIMEGAAMPHEVFHADGKTPMEIEEMPLVRAVRNGEVVKEAELVQVDARGQRLHLLCSAGPIRDSAGRIVGGVAASRDVTGRKRAEEELRRLSQFPGENPHPVLRCTPDGVMAYANIPARVWLATFGWQAGGPLPPSVCAAVAKAHERGNVIETEITNPEGRTLHLSVVQPPGEEYINLYGMDITERKRADEALVESEQRVRRKLDSVLSPEGDLGVLELVDLIDVPALQGLMENFYAVAGVPMSIMNDKGHVLVGVGWQDICTRFHRVHPVTSRKCRECDAVLPAGLAQGECRLHKCANNLWDMATPIFVAGRHTGNIYTGQFFFADETVDRELFRSQARKYGFDEGEYLAALDRVPRLTRETVDRGMAFFLELAATLSQHGYANAKLARLLAERDRLTDSLRESEALYQAIARNFPDGAIHIFDQDLRFRVADGQAEAALGFCREGLEGRTIWEATDEETCRIMEERYPRVLAGESLHFETPLKGRVFSSAYVPIRNEQGKVIAGMEVIHDITERKKGEEAVRASEERLRALLDEKEVLLKEIHHRVKNNLQVISSLLSLQSEELKDASIRSIFQDVTHRVRSIAMVHEKLYQSSDLARIEFSEYARSLLQYLWRAHGTDEEGIRLTLDLDPVWLSVNTAVPCGLILNELVSNALKHAFRGRNSGEVAVSLHEGSQGEVSLCVRDDGTGMPEGIDLSQCRSLGLRLVHMLARQLRAAVEISHGAGTGFTITFGGPKT